MGTGVGLHQFLCPGQEEGGEEGDPLHWRVQESTSSPTMVGSRRRVFRKLECPMRLSQKEICVHFSEGNWSQFGWSAKKVKKELCNVLEFSRSKVAQLGPSWC